MKKILIIRLSSLGDIILTTPLLRELRRKYPDITIDFLVRKEYADIVLQFPWVNEIVILDTAKGHDEIQRVNSSLKGKNYDHVIDLHNNIRSRILRKGISKRVHIINKRIFKRWLLVKFKINLLKNAPDIIGRYFETAKELGIADTQEPPTFGKSFSKIENKIAICPGAKHWNKRWPAEYFVELCNKLIENNNTLVFFGSPEEKEYVDNIVNNLPQDKIENRCGKTSLVDLPQQIGECSLAITNDSGLMHIAQATDVPTIEIFGPTVKEFGFYPRSKNASVLNTDIDCRPCTTIGLEYCPKGHFKCMKDISPEMVYQLLPK